MSSDTVLQIRDLARAGWQMCITPEMSVFGAVYCTLRWTLERNEMDMVLDGASAVPVEMKCSLIEGDGLEVAIAEFHARVFPVSMDGLSWEDGDVGDVPPEEL